MKQEIAERAHCVCDCLIKLGITECMLYMGVIVYYREHTVYEIKEQNGNYKECMLCIRGKYEMGDDTVNSAAAHTLFNKFLQH
jgi:hypothetical protein